MKSKNGTKRYVEWLSAEELHGQSQNWISILNFSKDEQKFLDNLITNFTLDLLDSKVFNKVQKAIIELRDVENEFTQLFKKVKLHGSQLQIMVDDVDQLKMEEAYLVTHKNLTIEIHKYLAKYQSVKTKIFNIVSSVIRKKKKKRLLKP